MRFKEFYTQMLSESRPLQLPEGFKELADDIFYSVKSSYEEEAPTYRERITPEEYYKEEEPNDDFFLVYDKIHTLDTKRIRVCGFIPTKDSNQTVGGTADIQDNIINLMLPLYDINFNFIHAVIIHELTHLYDTHNLYSSALKYIDKGLGKNVTDDYTTYDFTKDDLSRYYNKVGYRAGKIPIEFNPMVIEIIHATSKSQIKQFLKTLNIDLLLPTVLHGFVSEVLKHKYLKKKLLEKLYNYAYKRDEQADIYHGDICVYDGDSLTTQRKTPHIANLWNRTDFVEAHEEVGMDAVYKEFTDHNEFKAAVRRYLSQHNHNDAMQFIDTFDELESLPGIYKLIAQEDHGILMFGKEVY